MASVRGQLQSLLGRGKQARNIEEPWWMPEYSTGKALSGLAESIGAGYDKAKTRAKNAVIAGVNLLPDLSKLIRNENDLVNYENMSADLSKKASHHTETSTYAPFIQGVAGNLREDYNMYTKSMESGAKFIDNPNFITDMQGWDDLENTVAKMTLDDGETPKYQGNGTLLFLTEQSNAINSLIGRIQNSSKGTQFRYNKAGNKYTDEEMIKKLTEYQGRLGVALEASLGDGIITKEEAESIILGDLPAYQKRKGTALKRIDSHYNKLDKLQQTLKNKYDSIVLKNEGFDFSEMIQGLNIDLSTIQTQLELDEDGETIEGGEFIDTDISATSKQDILTQLEDRIGTIHGYKDQYKKSYTGWSGESFRPKVTVSKKEKEDLLGNIMTVGGDTSPLSTQITGVTDQGQGEIDVATVDEKKKDKATSKIYDQKPSKTDIDEKKYSAKRPDLFPTLKRSNGKFVFVDGKDLKEWDNKASIKDFDERVPVLDAGYDKFYWHNGKWRHISSAERKAPVTSKRVLEESEYETEVAFKEASKDIKKMAKKLGYSDVGDATKKTKGKPVAENVYKYSKSLWEQLPKETKAQFGSFNAFMEAVIEQQSTGLEIITE